MASTEDRREKYRGDGPPIPIRESTDPNRFSFRWLGREARGSTYTSYTQFSDRPGCSFDFGSDGYTASCNLGGELLQFMIPSETLGHVTARAGVDDSLSCIAASTQRYNGHKSAFGLKLNSIRGVGQNNGSTISLGRLVERGSFNYRWPFHEHALVQDDQQDREAGTCALFSFVREGVLYQVMHLEQGCRPEAEKCVLFPKSSVITLQLNTPSKFKSCPDDLPTPVNLNVKLHWIGPGDEQLKEIKNDESSHGGASDKPSLSPTGLVNVPIRKRRFDSDISVTFVLSIRLREKSADDTSLPILNSEEIYNWIGVDPLSNWATGAMWETLFIQREDTINCVSELTEVNLVARCLERILHVDAVPQERREADRMRPLALLSHIFLRVELDMQALFWKVRFLLKAYRFLVQQHSGGLGENSKVNLRPSTTGLDFHSKWNHAEFQSPLIKSDINRILSFVSTFLESRWDKWPVILASPARDPRSYYYVMITIWYLIKNGFSPVPGMKNLDIGISRLASLLPPDNTYFGKDSECEVFLLKWCHYGSISQLVTKGLLSSSWEEGGLYEKVPKLRRAAKVALAGKISSKRPYLPSDEIVDRLAFLADELGLEDDGSHMFSLAMRRIRHRDYTRSINPGYLPKDWNGDACAPWEIYALSHHSRLLVANLEGEGHDFESRKRLRIEEVEKYKRKFCMFLTTEASLIPCWDRASMTTCQAWFRSETTSVLASTLLDIYRKDMEQLPLGAAQAPLGNQKRGPGDGRSQSFDGHDHHLSDTQIFPTAHGPLTLDAKIEQLCGSNSKLVNQLAERVDSPPIDWTIFKPPRRYHPSNFFESLDDTPHKYSKINMDHVRVPNSLRDYLTAEDGTLFKAQEWTKDRLGRTDDVANISLVDIMGFNLTTNLEVPPMIFGKLTPPVAVSGSTVSWDCAGAQGEEDYTSITLDELGKDKLIKALSRSLVNQGVQHRMLVMPDLSKDLVELLVYVILPESVDCLANHILGISHFSFHTKASWVARLTVRCWMLEEDKPEKPEEDKWASSSGNMSKVRGRGPQPSSKSHQGNEDDPIVLPGRLLPALKQLDKTRYDEHNLRPKRVVLRVSSIITSTNSFGDFSKTAIISKIISGSKLRSAGKKAQRLWRIFVHQPQTARCLVFLLLLGMLCQEIAKQFRDAANYFVNILNLDNSFLRGDIDYVRDQDSIGTLRLVLWCLESLYKLQNSLDETLNAVLQAKSDLMTQINEGPGKRSKALERICQETLEAFESKLLELVAAKVRLSSKIELNRRQGDATSALLQLRDNRISYEQNMTIEKLTYLTIIYLPLGLVAAIFTIPDTQSVVQNNIGMGWFVGAIFVMLVVTIAVAAFLSQLMDIVKAAGKQILGFSQFLSNRTYGPPPGGPGGAIPLADDADISPKLRPELPNESGGGMLSSPSASSSNKESGVSALHSLQRTGQRLTTKWRTRATRILGQRRLPSDSQQGVEHLDVQVRDKDGAV